MAFRRRIHLDQIVVVDLEATCWKGKPPAGQQREIIEIGVCTLDLETGERLARESILVKPTLSAVSEFCTELTTLTQVQVDTGISFKEACRILKKKYKSPERTWASYGDYDRAKFVQQCADFDLPYPFSDRHINVKNLFAVVHGLKREVGMAKALEIRQMALEEGTHHRGDDDAWNTAKLLSELLLHGRSIQSRDVSADDNL